MAEEPLEPILDPEEEEGGPVKTFLEHLEDLRWVLIKCFAALLLGMAACLVASPQIIEVLKWPLIKSGSDINPVTFGPVGGVVISMKVALWGGVTLALPFILYFIADFVVPALKRTEKKYFIRAFIIGGGLFIAGILLCYFVMMQVSLKGLAAYNAWLNLPSDVWRAEEYFSFVLMFMVGMGVAFEIPVLILTLVRMGVIPHETLVKGRMYFYVGAMVVCAFITPDALSTVFMVVPVIVLMEICILISKHWERQRRLAEAAELAASRHLTDSADTPARP